MINVIDKQMGSLFGSNSNSGDIRHLLQEMYVQQYKKITPLGEVNKERKRIM